MKTKLLITLLLSCIVHFYTSQSIDAAFGAGGSKTLNNVGWFYDSVTTGDGNILLPGSYDENGVSKAVLMKMKPDGSLDTAFGVNGKFEIDQYADPNVFEAFDNVRVLPDGKILLLYGYEIDNDIDPEIYSTKLIRLHADGQIDNTFNNSMTVGNNNAWNGFEVLSSGNILGFTDNSLRRVFSNGTVDTSYANNGVRQLTFEPDQLLVGTGGIFIVDYSGQRIVKLPNEESTNATSFNNGNYIYTVLMHDNHLYVESGHAQTNDTSVIKLDSNLAPDQSYGTNGIYTFPSGIYARLIAVQANGSVLSGTDSRDPDSNIQTFTMQRVNPNGTRDTTFGNQGIFNHSVTGSFYTEWLYHPQLKKMYTFMEPDGAYNTLVVMRFNLPNETLGTHDASTDRRIKLLQNPVGDILKLSAKITNGAFYNAAGNKAGVTAEGDQISVSHLTPGFYIISALDNEGKTVNIKFIKK